MTFLPIVGRELRVAARRGATHWARFALTALVSLVMANYFAISGLGNPPSIGRTAFEWLLGAAFVLACAGCTLTADTLSAERREGTLGLLFLTDLRPWDVTLGKLTSAGLGAVYAGIAFVPLLMIPLLAGGVTALEAARTGLALLTILLLALTAGLAVSARELDRVRALRRAALWMVGAVILPVLPAWYGALLPAVRAFVGLVALLLYALVIGRLASARGMNRARLLPRTIMWVMGPVIVAVLADWLGTSSFAASISLLSPVTTVLRAQDTAYRVAPMDFWVSLGIQFLHAGLLLLWAGACLRRQVIESVVQPPPRPRISSKEPEVYSSDPFSTASYLAVNPPKPPEPAPGRPFDEARPLRWLVRRQPGQQALCWTAAVLWVVSSHYYLVLSYLGLGPRGGTLPLAWYLFPHLSWIGDALMAWAACRFFFDARRSGELELLLTTPVGAQAMISEHWAAMRRLLRWPLVLVMLPLVLLAGIAFLEPVRALSGSGAASQIYTRLYALGHTCEILLTVLALNGLGMWRGLQARRLFSAVGLTVALAAGLPMMIHFLWQVIVRLYFTSGGIFSSGNVVWLLGCFPIIYATLLGLTYWVHRRLRRGLLAEPTRLDWR